MSRFTFSSMNKERHFNRYLLQR